MSAISGRSADGARDVDSGTTMISSSGTSEFSSSTENTTAGRFLPASPLRAAPNETSQTSPRLGLTPARQRQLRPSPALRDAPLGYSHQPVSPAAPTPRSRLSPVPVPSRPVKPLQTSPAAAPESPAIHVLSAIPESSPSDPPYRQIIAPSFVAKQLNRLATPRRPTPKCRSENSAHNPLQTKEPAPPGTGPVACCLL